MTVYDNDQCKCMHFTNNITFTNSLCYSSDIGYQWYHLQQQNTYSSNYFTYYFQQQLVTVEMLHIVVVINISNVTCSKRYLLQQCYLQQRCYL